MGHFPLYPIRVNLEFRGQMSKTQYLDIFFWNPDIDLVLIDPEHRFLRYILPEISYWEYFVMFDLEFQFKGQGHDNSTYFMNSVTSVQYL